MTGLGLYMGMKACAEEVWGNGGLRGKTVAVQGFGKVASHLCEHLLEDDARLVVTDVYDGALDRARDMGLEVTPPDSIMDVDCDIFAPCALGGVLNPQTIPHLRNAAWWPGEPTTSSSARPTARNCTAGASSTPRTIS